MINVGKAVSGGGGVVVIFVVDLCPLITSMTGKTTHHFTELQKTIT